MKNTESLRWNLSLALAELRVANITKEGKGYPAAWLEEKINDNDVTRITCECIEFKRGDGDEY